MTKPRSYLEFRPSGVVLIRVWDFIDPNTMLIEHRDIKERHFHSIWEAVEFCKDNSIEDAVMKFYSK